MLRTCRKGQKLSQAELALKSKLSRPTIRLLESGRGNIRTLGVVLNVLRVELRGKNLPGAETLGRQLALIRRRSRISQRELASLIGTTQPSIVNLERRVTGRVQTLDRALAVLGAGSILVPKGETPAFYSHAGNSSAHHGWHSPKWLMQILYGVFGTFDLDPCSPTRNRRQAPVRARVHFTQEDNGLAVPWHGCVFVNPPYGRELKNWTRKAREEVASGNAHTVVALIASRTDTNWWHQDVAGHASVLFLRGRLRFGDGEQSAPFPSAIVIWGGTRGKIEQLATALPEAWGLPRANYDGQS